MAIDSLKIVIITWFSFRNLMSYYYWWKATYEKGTID